MTDQDDKRPPPLTEGDPDAPPSAEEALASSRLRDALDRADAGGALPKEIAASVELVQSLQAAWAPLPMDPHEHEEIVDDVPTVEELALASQLRDALAEVPPLGGPTAPVGRPEVPPSGGPTAPVGRPEDHALPDVVVALRSAWSPSALGDTEHRAIVARAVGIASGNVIPFRARGSAVRVIVVSTTTVLALAASVVVWMTTAGAPQETPLARARSTQPLFGEPFKAGETSARIDKIALARASDYRDNRFAKWGVR